MSSNPRVPYELASHRRRLEPPDGRPIIVNVVMNIEHWPIGRPMPRGILPAPHGAKVEPPDVPNFSWVEYGMRVGMARMLDMLGGRKLPVTTFFNAEVADVYPTLAKEVLEAGWEFVGHGWFQRSLKQVEDETAEIGRCLARLEQLTGRKTRGWFGAGGGETERTPDLLKAAGLDFIHDWVVDDLPFWITTQHGPLVGLPYTWELNDVPIWAVQSQSSDELHKRLEWSLAVLERETARQPRVVTLGLHPHIVGVPHRAYWLEKSLDLLQSRRDVVFMTSSGIADWFVAADKGAR
jgi:hypothetical protein